MSSKKQIVTKRENNKMEKWLIRENRTAYLFPDVSTVTTIEKPINNDFNSNTIPELEKGYKVQYPSSLNATYKSLVNYGTDLQSPIQRWYRYKEGYSTRLMQQLFEKYQVKQGDLILDPFCGSGSTLLQAKVNQFKGIGFEINPFSAFLAKVKTQNYNETDLNDFKTELKHLLLVDTIESSFDKPNLSTIDKLFTKDVFNYLQALHSAIQKIRNPKAKDLFSLAWLSILEDASNYRKAGNGLKIRKGKTLLVRNLDYAKRLFRNRIEEIEDDLPTAIKISQNRYEPKIYEHTSLELNQFVNSNTIKGVIFSPPYANCFDYTEIYKVELWVGGFVKTYNDLKYLRKRGVRSHLNGYEIENTNNPYSPSELEMLVDTLKSVKLWDKRIPLMVNNYFTDMFKALDNIYNVLKPDGFCCIIVSNSAYGGIVVPTDLLLTKYAETIGFNPLKIEVARYIITSSQQYKQTMQHRKYLRESIIHLQK